MDKITFENGIQVSPARVNEDGTITPAQYEGNTPFSAHVMNLLQSKLEKSVVAVSPTQPTTNENVWIKKGKNLFDNTFIQMRDDAPSTTRVEGKKIPLENVFDTPQAVSLSNNLNLSTYKWSVNIKTNTGGNYDYDSGWIENANNWTVSQSRISEFMSRGNPQIYFVIAKKDETNIYVSEMNNYNFQIEVSTTATTFEPYVEKEILVKNDNGVFEKFSLLTYETNIIELDSSVISGGTLRYEKMGNLVILYFEAIKCINPPSGIWKDMEIAILPKNLRPKNFIVRAIGRSDNNGKMCILNVSPSGRVYVTDRGTGDLSSEAIVGQVIFVSA